MMRKVSVHQDDIVASTSLESFDVRAAEAKFPGSCMQLQLRSINFLQLSHDVLGAVG